MIIFDCEIEKAIPDKDRNPLEGVSYCKGWTDFEGMGLSCICAYDYNEGRYRVFLKDNFDDFEALIDNHSPIVGFNSIGFDNRLLEANGIIIPPYKSYDLLAEIWSAAGLSREFQYPSHLGFGLDAICQANFALNKSGNGALAPIWFQRGNIGLVIDYCLHDVHLTRVLLDHVRAGYPLRDPRDPSKFLGRVHTPAESFYDLC